MSTSQTFLFVRSESIASISPSSPSLPNSPLSSDAYYISSNTPSAYDSTESLSSTVHASLATTPTPHLLPTPTRQLWPDSVDSNNSLIALHTAVVLCVVLAAVVLVLVVVVLVMCWRHSKQSRKKSLCSPRPDSNSPKKLHNRSQHSFSGNVE